MTDLERQVTAVTIERLLRQIDARNARIEKLEMALHEIVNIIQRLGDLPTQEPPR
jgi:hypothetical protein